MTNQQRFWCSDRSQIAHAVDIFVQHDLSCRHVVDPLRVAHRQWDIVHPQRPSAFQRFKISFT